MATDTSLALYVHWPYCARICPYCDFNVYKNRDIDAARWRDALRRDMDYWAERTKERTLTSIYFGGGTPSLAPLEVIEGVIDHAAKLWSFDGTPEITLEANPTDAQRKRFESFAAIGINRLSLGVQSLRDEALTFLGRDHNAPEARRAIDAALSIFPKATFDLIYGRPQQTNNDWRAELSEALAIGPSHLSLYQLTIEPGTAFGAQVAARRWSPPDDDIGAAHFEIAHQLTNEAGLVPYETSNFAATDHQSRHNLTYWRYKDYIGIGPGAHGRVTQGSDKVASVTHKKPEDYLSATEDSGHGVCELEFLTDEEQLTERLTMGLRLHEGITLYADDQFYVDETRAEKLNQLTADGLISNDCGRVALTPQGRPLLNRIIYELLT